MAENAPTLKEWRKLYKAAIRVKEIAPWEWMTEEDIFGVQNPETDELGFVSVMGMLGEHYAIALYLGPRGLYGLLDLEDAGPSASPESVLEIPQLQASFEDRNTLHNKDRETIKKLGLKFRGRQAWAMFRSLRPGFFPWFLEREEARFLTYALEQVPDVALRFEEDPSLLEPPDDESYLVRVPLREDDTLYWEDRIISVPPPEPLLVSVSMDAEELEDLKHLAQTKHKIEMDFFMLPSPVREKGARPYFPYVLMTVEPQSGAVLGAEFLTPEPSLEVMWGLVPKNIVHQLTSMAELGIVPREIRVSSRLLAQLLGPLGEELGFNLKTSRTLQSLDFAKQFLLSRV